MQLGELADLPRVLAQSRAVVEASRNRERPPHAYLGTSGARAYFPIMPLYSFNVLNLNPSTPASSEDFSDDEAAWKEATRFAADLLRDVDGKLRPGEEWALEVTDEAGKSIFNIQISTRTTK
jgi:hypothetical protein